MLKSESSNTYRTALRNDPRVALRRGGLGSITSIVFITLIILMALFLFVKITSV